MSWTHLLPWFRRYPSPDRWPSSARGRYRPRVEALEGRRLPSTVTNLNDSGPGSLRDAIANTPAGGTVDFQPGLTGAITLASLPLAVDKALTIAGPGAQSITVQQASSGAAGFNISASAQPVMISGLTIVHSFPGIMNAGTLTLTDSILQGNGSVVPCCGTPEGGGINNSGTLTVINSTLRGNFLDAAFGARGGGIYNSGTATVINSTLSGNEVSASKTGAGGGGIWSNGTLTLINCTLSGNHASANTLAGPAGRGGGIAAGGTVTLINTLVAGNTANESGPDISGAVVKSNHDLIGNGDGSTGLVNGQNGNQVGTTATPIDPKLGPLQDNGGPTPTQALLPGSPAIDAADNAASPGPTDQRGLPRIVNGVIDVGAYESQTTGFFALGGVPGRVQVRSRGSGAVLADFAPYGASFTGPVTVAV